MSDSTVKPTSLTAWKKAKIHPVTLPSGTTVEISLPDIPALIEAGTIPQHLMDAAIGAVKGDAPEKPSEEQMAKQREFVREVVSRTVVNPKVAIGEVEELPVEDRDMIMAFAMRQTDMDAAYNHIGGLHNVKSFREARGLSFGDSLLADL